ncbi:MAG: DUF177 domain-containing protein [Pseudomonadota bacterium]
MLDWTHTTDSIPQDGAAFAQSADLAAREMMAAEFNLLGCHALRLDYTIRPRSDGRYQVSGTLRAEIVQACVVTLEPVTQTIQETFDVTFCPPDQLENDEPEFDALEADDREPLERDQIPVGRVLAQILSLAIPPFPRADGASLHRIEAGQDPDDTAQSPFAALAQLRQPNDKGSGES